MLSLLQQKQKDRRRAKREIVNRLAKLQLATGSLPRDCLVTDMSEGGVRLHVEGLEVPDQFTLLLAGAESEARRDCHVVWRLGYEIGVKFLDKFR